MHIVSWNCHYGLTKDKFNSLMTKEDKKFFNADIYALQEVRENDFIDIADFGLSEEYKYRHWYGDHQEFGDCHIAGAREGDLGIALISKMKFHRFDQGRIRHRYVVPYVFIDEKNQEKFILIHVWTKSEPEGYFEPVYNALEYYKTQFKELPIIMLGDFNFGVKYDDSFLNKFENIIENQITDLKKASFKGKSTKTFYYPQKPDKEYFNDCLFAKGCDGRFEVGDQKIWLEKNNSSLSDHCPIIAEISL